MAKSYFETLMEDRNRSALEVPKRAAGYVGELGSSLLDRLSRLNIPLLNPIGAMGSGESARDFARTFDPASSEDVMKLQGLMGFSEAEQDGVFGPETEAALRELQGVPGSSEEVDNMAQGLVGGEIGQTDEIEETVENLSEWAPSSVGEGTPMLSPLGQYMSSKEPDDFVDSFIQGKDVGLSDEFLYGEQEKEDIIQSYDDRAWLNQAIRAKGIRDAIARDNMQQDNPFFREAPEIEDVDMETEGLDIAPKSLLQGAVRNEEAVRNKEVDSFERTWLDSRDFLGKGFRKVPYTMGNQKIEFIMDLNTGTLVGVPERFKGKLRDKSLVGPNTFKPFIKPSLTRWDGNELKLINPTENLRNRFRG